MIYDMNYNGLQGGGSLNRASYARYRECPTRCDGVYFTVSSLRHSEKLKPSARYVNQSPIA